MKVVGIKNLVLDYYFFDNEIYINGGGTVCNILSNLSKMGIPTKIIGYYGFDKMGEIAKISLEKCNVDISDLERKEYHTKCFFINPKKTTAVCPYCNKKTKDHSLKKDINIKKDDILLIQDYVLLNNLKNKICLDFSSFFSLIYKDKKEIENFIFRNYYIVSIKEKALLFLLKKLDMTFNQFIQKSNIYFLIITKEKKGATILFNKKEYNYYNTPFKEIETNGCGDIFLATFICEILKRTTLNKKDIDEIYQLALKNVHIVLQNIGARNHIIKNIKIKKKENKCICEDFEIVK